MNKIKTIKVELKDMNFTDLNETSGRNPGETIGEMIEDIEKTYKVKIIPNKNYTIKISGKTKNVLRTIEEMVSILGFEDEWISVLGNDLFKELVENKYLLQDEMDDTLYYVSN